MKTRVYVLGLVLLIVLSASEVQAVTRPGLADVHARIDRIVTLLQAPGRTHEERRRAVLTEAEPAFDWREMARAALGPTWRERTPAERAEFTRLFQALVEDTYLTRVLRHHGEKVAYGRETVHWDVALLSTRIVRTKGAPVSVDYELLHRGDRWLVTDILVERIGLVNNYRAQLAAILSRSSYRQLIARMRARISGLA
jgi:phospholipid transport system substrate-binding protein